MLRLLLALLLLALPAAAQQVLSTDPAEVVVIAGNKPDPTGVPNLPRLLEAQIRDFVWSAEVAWNPEPNYGNLYASRFTVRSVQPVGALAVGGKEETTDQNYKLTIRNTQMFPLSPVSVTPDGTVSQNWQLACYLQVDFGPRSWVLSVPRKTVTLKYKVTWPKG